MRRRDFTAGLAFAALMRGARGVRPFSSLHDEQLLLVARGVGPRSLLEERTSTSADGDFRSRCASRTRRRLS